MAAATIPESSCLTEGNHHIQKLLKDRRWTTVSVSEPVSISTKHLGWKSSFTTYLVRVETNHWAFSMPVSAVRRRFSEFCWLRTKLEKHHLYKVVPPLPKKHFMDQNNLDPEVIEERRVGLCTFLQRIVRSSEFLSDSALHLFLQSDLSTEEIDDRLSQERPPMYNHHTQLLDVTLRRNSKLSLEVEVFDAFPHVQRHPTEAKSSTQMTQSTRL